MNLSLVMSKPCPNPSQAKTETEAGKVKRVEKGLSRGWGSSSGQGPTPCTEQIETGTRASQEKKGSTQLAKRSSKNLQSALENLSLQCAVPWHSRS